MGRRVSGIAVMWAGAFALVIGVSALLARSAPSAPQVLRAGPRTVAAIRGEGAAAGNIGETTLHHAHVRGSEPIPCRACHDLGRAEFARPDRERCLGCHPARKAALHAAVEATDIAVVDQDPRQCTRCHDFLDTRPAAERAWQCDDCHPEPHRDLKMAATTAETCGRCHSPHGDEALAPRACIGCHEDHATEHQTTGDPGTASCLACHGQHDAKANAVGRCPTCHQTTEPRVSAAALFRGGHDTCTTCHPPHAFSRRTVKTCTSCHTGERALAADRVGAHRDCRNCHDQHDVATDARHSCQRCHDRVSPTHPANPHGDDCLGCHPAHPARTETAAVAVACASCHLAARDDRAFHRGAACGDCHREHGFKLAARPALCLGCHARRVGQAEAVTVSTAHGDCARCHGDQPHAPAAAPPCASCHELQGRTVPAGHATCTDCHEPHTGELRRRAAACVNCHADRKAGPHGRIAGGCQTCHRPHAPDGVAAPAPCDSCHARAERAGMHQHAGHQQCTDCHQPHGPPPDRETCLRCHTDRRAHEPAASSCAGCHPFGKGAP